MSEAGLVLVTFNFSGSGIGEDPETFSELDRFEANTIGKEIEDLGAVLDAVLSRSDLPYWRGPTEAGLGRWATAAEAGLSWSEPAGIPGFARSSPGRRWPPSTGLERRGQEPLEGDGASRGGECNAPGQVIRIGASGCSRTWRPIATLMTRPRPPRRFRFRSCSSSTGLRTNQSRWTRPSNPELATAGSRAKSQLTLIRGGRPHLRGRPPLGGLQPRTSIG